MKISIAAMVLLLFATSLASAQSNAGIPIGSGPGGVPFGAGQQRGMQGLNNSGQAGFVTMFDRGASRTAVVVAIEGAHGRPQRVEFHRGSSCDAIGRFVFRLNDLKAGFSRGFAPMSEHNLFSGNYLTVVYGGANANARPVACGELFH